MARPAIYTDEKVVAIQTTGAATKLQNASERRAIVNVIIDHGGAMTLKEVDDHFGYDIRNQVISLIRTGWLALREPE